jgi:hypothetical protein
MGGKDAAMSASRAKGTAAETAVVRFLQANGYPSAERRALAGVNDRGDVAGIPGLVIEVKAEKRLELARYVDEALTEAGLDDLGIVWHKRVRRGNPGEWYVSMEGWTFLAFLERWTDADTA